MNTTQKEFVVYEIVDVVDNFLIYIGYTSNFFWRSFHYYNTIFRKDPVVRYMRTYSDYKTRFHISIISTFTTKRDALIFETQSIKSRNPWSNSMHSNFRNKEHILPLKTKPNNL
jgi:hypothetical protein